MTWNKGVYYIANVTMDVSMATAVNPEYLSGGIQRTLQGADYTACGGAFQTRNVQQFNNTCRFPGQNWAASFEAWAYGHEAQHMYNVVSLIANNPGFDAKYVLANIYAAGAAALVTEANSRLGRVVKCVQQAGVTHAGFPGIAVNLYYWSTTTNRFSNYFPQGHIWWSLHPMTDECVGGL